MLENLNQLVRENVQDTVVNNQDIPNEKNEEVIQAASGSIFDSLKDQLSSGNLDALADVFQSGNAGNSPVAQQAAGSFTDKLAGLGINAATAKSIAASVIPVIVGKFASKTTDPNDHSFNIADVLGKLGGSDGKFDVSDILGMFNGRQNTQTNQLNGSSPDGGILDKLKGMF